MEKISWTNRVRNEEVLHRVKEERNILHTVERRKIEWIGCILCRNCFLEHVTEGKIQGLIEVRERGGRVRKQLLDDLREMKGYWTLKEEALYRTVWTIGTGSVYGTVVRETTDRQNECMNKILVQSLGLLTTEYDSLTQFSSLRLRPSTPSNRSGDFLG